MNKLEIVIGDKKYNIKTDESPEHVLNIENIINDQIKSISNSNKKFNDVDRIILSIIVFADKYLKQLNEMKSFKNDVADQFKILKEQREKAEIQKYEAEKNLKDSIFEMERYKEKLSNRDNDREFYSEQLKKSQEKVTEQESQLARTEILIKDLKRKNEELQELNEQLIKDNENYNKELLFVNNTKNSLSGRISKLQLKLNEKEQEILSLEDTITQLNTFIEEKNQIIEGYNLNHDIIKTKLENNEKNHEEKNSKIVFLNESLLEKDEEISSKNKTIEDLKSKVSNFEKNLDTINEDKEKYLEELLMTNSEKESMNNTINELQDKLNRKETEIFQNRIEIEQLKNEKNELLELLDEQTRAD